MKRWPYILTIVALVLACIGLSIDLFKPKPIHEPICIHDTITRTDTLIQERVEWKYRTMHDTLIVWSHDSITDTISVEIPIDHYEYTDHVGNDTASVDIDIKYSGYKAKLDSVQISYNFDAPIEVIEKKKGFGQFVGIGVGVGYGVCVLNTNIKAAPYVGVSIVYGFGYHW